MFAKPFDYHAAESVDAAVDLLVEYRDSETKLLAGGHSLLPMMKSGLAAPDVIVDIGRIAGLDRIDSDGDTITIGGLTTYETIAQSTIIQSQNPAIAEAAASIGDIQVRNRGTIGGNIAHADPASDLPAALLAVDGTVTTRTPDGERSIPADDFFLGMYETAVGETALLTEIEVPALGEDTLAGYVKKPSQSSGYALVGVAGVISLAGDSIASARVAVNGAFDHATRLTAVEDALVDRSIEDGLAEEVGPKATDGFETSMFMDDLQTSSEFRAQLLEVYTERLLSSLFEQGDASDDA